MHRYFYQVIALGEGLDVGKMSKVPTKEEIGREVSVEGRFSLGGVGWRCGEEIGGMLNVGRSVVISCLNTQSVFN